MREKSTSTAWIDTKCGRRVANIFMNEAKQRITYKDLNNNIEFLSIIR